MKYQICLSGAARGKSVKEGYDQAFKIGQLLGERGHVLLTGATVGLPYAAAKGIKSVGGQSIGISPAATRYAHIKKYRLPTDMFDVVLYTGLNYVGRDTLLVNCAEAVISIGGRMGTTHEFAIAMETAKPVAVLEGSGGTSELFDDLLLAAGRGKEGVIFESDPVILVDKLIKHLDVKYAKLAKIEPNIIHGKPQENAITNDAQLEDSA